jgi:hypothetical protein
VWVISGKNGKGNLFIIEFTSQVKLPVLVLFSGYDLTPFLSGEMEGRLTELVYKY